MEREKQREKERQSRQQQVSENNVKDKKELFGSPVKVCFFGFFFFIFFVVRNNIFIKFAADSTFPCRPDRFRISFRFDKRNR